MISSILMSGGIDSVALAYWKKPAFAFTIDYGQRPAYAEIHASSAVCHELKIEHMIITVDCSKLGTGDLSDRKTLSVAPSPEWWPYRNQLLVTLACMKAVELGVDEMMLASVKSDGFHKDGTNDFYEKLNALVSYQEGNISVSAPGICLSSVELVISSRVPPEILYYAHSCHTSNFPCGHCGGCYKHIDVINELENGIWKKSDT